MFKIAGQTISCILFIKMKKLYGSMDVGIYNSVVDDTVYSVKTRVIIVAILLLVVITGLLGTIVSLEMKDFTKLTDIFDSMGAGDFTASMNAKLADVHDKSDEIGRITGLAVNKTTR